MSSSIACIKAIVESNSRVKGLAFLFVLFELASYVRSKQIFLAQWNLQCTSACRRILSSLDSLLPLSLIKRRIHSLRHLKQLSSRYVVQFRSEKLTLRETWRLLLEKQMVAVKQTLAGKCCYGFQQRNHPCGTDGRSDMCRFHVLTQTINEILGFSAETMLLNLLQFEL